MMFLCLNAEPHPVLGLFPTYKFYKITASNPISGLIRQEILYEPEIDAEEVGGDVYHIGRDGIYEASSQYFEEGCCVYSESQYYTYINSELREISEAELIELLNDNKNAAQVVEHPSGECK